MTTIEILNLKCGGCSNTIKMGITAIEGIHEVILNLNTSVVRIDSMDELVISQVREKLSSMGYPEVGNNKKNT